MSAPATDKSFTCSRCNLVFTSKKILRNHGRDEHPKCRQCRKKFLGLAEVQKHQRKTEHCYCRECDIYFPSVAEHLTHVRSVTHTTPYHCCDCNREYTNGDALSHHCCDCDKVLRSQRYLKKHLSQKSNILKVEGLESERPPKLQLKCKKCDAAFQSKKQLKQHMSSGKHIQCPIDEKCKKRFATPSALLNHLESGCCRSGMNSAKLRKLVFVHDQNRYITSVEAAESILSSEHSPARYYHFFECWSVEANDQSQLSCSSDLVKSSTDKLSGNNFLLPPPIFDDDNFREWFIVGDGQLTPTTSNSDWSIIGGNSFTPVYSDTASERSLRSEDLVHISSNTFSHHTNLNISSHEGTGPQKLRCNLCGPNQKLFRSVEGYQRHLNSAAHAPKIFHCPLSLMPNVKPEDLLKIRRFSTLGGLTSHLEAGGCQGGLELYSKAISFVEEQLKHLGFGDLMLLSN